MKKTLSFILFILLGISGIQAQLLYRISGNELKSSSYIFGTHHLAEVSFTEKISGLQAALDSAAQVYGEVNIATTTSMEGMMKMQKMMMLPDGKTLKDVLSSEQFDKLNTFSKEVLGYPFDNPLLFSQLGSMRPAVLESSIVTILYASNHPKTNILEGIDNFFQQEAKKADKPVGGLETAEFQSNLLFVDVPLEEQVKSLMCTIENKEYALDILNRLTEAYYAQDLEELEKINNEQNENLCDVSEEQIERLIYGRNENWAKQMSALMAKNPTFFAVGALHLCGERGVLELLRKAGYTIEAVK